MVTAIDKNTALVIVDLQNGIVKLPLVHPINEILVKVVDLVAAFRKANLPIVVVNVDPREMMASNIRKDAASRNVEFPPEFFEIVKEIEVKENDILITKKNWGAFSNPDLDIELKKRSVTGIVLVGISTSVGIEGTARGANERGYNIAFANDAMTDTIKSAHEHSLSNIFPRIGEVDTTANIIEMLNTGKV